MGEIPSEMRSIRQPPLRNTTAHHTRAFATTRASTPYPPSPSILLERHSDPLPPQSPGSVRLVFLSDTHGRHHRLCNNGALNNTTTTVVNGDSSHAQLPYGDILVHLGDAANRGSLTDVRSFVAWLADRPHPEKIFVDGNHDRDRKDAGRIDVRVECRRLQRLRSGGGGGDAVGGDGAGGDDNADDNELIKVLRDEAIHAGPGGRIRIYGASWESCENDDYTAARRGAPSAESVNGSGNEGGIDILLTHINPHLQGGGHGWSGSKPLTDLVREMEVPLHCFGHVHHGRGMKVLEGGVRDDSGDDNDGGGGEGKGSTGSIMVNCATAWDRPVVVDFCPEHKRVLMVHCPVPDYVRLARRFVDNGT